jgi:hypothetical protein
MEEGGWMMRTELRPCGLSERQKDSEVESARRSAAVVASIDGRALGAIEVVLLGLYPYSAAAGVLWNFVRPDSV